MESALQQQAECLYGPYVDLRAGGRLIPIDDAPDVDAEPSSLDVPVPRVKRPLTRTELRGLWAHVRTIENFWTTLNEIENGSVQRLATLARQHDWEIMFVTRRPATEGETAQVQTQRWLNARGFELPSVFVIGGSRGNVAQAFALDVVVDDDLDNAMDVASLSNARSILVWRDHPASIPPEASRLAHVVLSFSEAIDLLEEMSGPLTRAQRLLKRVRNALQI